MVQQQTVGASRSLDRVGQVLEYITQSRAGCTLAELQNHTAIPRSSLHALVGSLVGQDMLKREPSGRLVAGPSLVRWGARLIQRLDLRDVARPWMKILAHQTDFVVNLAEIDEERQDIVCLAKEQSGSFHTSVQVGNHLSLHSTALGKVLLAYAPMDWRGRYLSDDPFPARTMATVTQASLLTEELDRIRHRAWSEDHQENEEGVCAVGAPIRNYTGLVIAAISVALPNQFFEPCRLKIIDATVKTAHSISRELGAEG